MKNMASFLKITDSPMSLRIRIGLMGIFCILTMCIPLFAQDNIPDSSKIRKDIITTWLTQDITTLITQDSQILQNDVGEKFFVSAQKSDEEVRIIVAPLVSERIIREYRGLVPTDNMLQDKNTAILTDTNRGNTELPETRQGSWVLYRNARTGEPTRVRYYFMPDPEIYVEFTNSAQKSFSKFSIFGALVANRVPLPVSLDYFYTASFEDVIYLTQNTLPWHYAHVDKQIYDDTMQMIGVIRENLPDLQQNDVFTSSMGHLEFLTWIINGLIKPLTGSTLFTERLEISTMNNRKSITARNDTYKSFDYIRNLAAAAISASTGISYYYDTSGTDVTIEPFSLFTNTDGLVQKAGFVENAGYSIDILKPLLYVLAVTDPECFFLGAIRERITTSSGGGPERHIYNKAVAIFPWFDPLGHFQITIFEEGVEFTYDQFVERYPNTFIHLVRIKSSMNFYPEQSIKSDILED